MQDARQKLIDSTSVTPPRAETIVKSMEMEMETQRMAYIVLLLCAKRLSQGADGEGVASIRNDRGARAKSFSLWRRTKGHEIKNKNQTKNKNYTDEDKNCQSKLLHKKFLNVVHKVCQNRRAQGQEEPATTDNRGCENTA
nr:hypothetical protein BaRGS_011951 [Batillaria attramentaria]